MAVTVHPTAIVDPKATLDDGVSIGPFCVVGPGAFIGKNTKLMSHVVIDGNVRMGEDNVVYPQCVFGAEPQDKSYRGSPTWVVIGDRNVFRELMTIHRATEKELGITRVGSDNYFMAGVHLAHDVICGSHVTIANNTLVAGHVHVHDHAAISGGCGIHHYVTIGGYGFVGALSKLVRDVPPYMLMEGAPADVRCVNLVGLRRRGFTNPELLALAEAHRLLYRSKVGLAEARATLEADGNMKGPVVKLFEFLEERASGGRFGRGREGRKAA